MICNVVSKLVLGPQDLTTRADDEIFGRLRIYLPATIVEGRKELASQRRKAVWLCGVVQRSIRAILGCCDDQCNANSCAYRMEAYIREISTVASLKREEMQSTTADWNKV